MTPTTGDANATIEWLDATNATLDDTDLNKTGFQVDLAVGDITFKVAWATSRQPDVWEFGVGALGASLHAWGWEHLWAVARTRRRRAAGKSGAAPPR